MNKNHLTKINKIKKRTLTMFMTIQNVKNIQQQQERTSVWSPNSCGFHQKSSPLLCSYKGNEFFYDL